MQAYSTVSMQSEARGLRCCDASRVRRSCFARRIPATGLDSRRITGWRSGPSLPCKDTANGVKVRHMKTYFGKPGPGKLSRYN